MNPRECSPAIGCLLGALAAILLLAGTAWAQHEQAYPFNGANGAYPQGGLIVDGAGNFYGSTFRGGPSNLGVVYEMSPTANGKATESVLHTFQGGSDGANPIGNLVFDNAGNLYGVTEKGGVLNFGTVFELSPPSQGSSWTETVLYSFQGGPSDGTYPEAGLVFDEAGNLYGTPPAGISAAPAATPYSN